VLVNGVHDLSYVTTTLSRTNRLFILKTHGDHRYSVYAMTQRQM
jgi:hypothetical protein